jgi:hypothetical protein
MRDSNLSEGNFNITHAEYQILAEFFLYKWKIEDVTLFIPDGDAIKMKVIRV